EVAFPEAVEAAGRDIGKVERGGAEAAHAGHFPHDMAKLDEELAVVAPAEMRNAAADDGIGKVLARGDAQTAIVEEGPAAALGGEELVRRRIQHHRRDDLAVTLERDGDGEARNAVQEIGRAVERIDDPAMRAVRAGDLLGFLAEEAV